MSARYETRNQDFLLSLLLLLVGNRDDSTYYHSDSRFAPSLSESASSSPRVSLGYRDLAKCPYGGKSIE